MKALVLVDIQNDFCPGGALAVPGGDGVIPVVARVRDLFDVVVATQDWHPPGHKSFASSHRLSVGEVIDLNGQPQFLWPDHCVQHTAGADLRRDLPLRPSDRVIRKGMDPEVDSYSGFFDNDHRRETELNDFLRARGVEEIFLAGLATDYCVKYTALDGVALGYRVFLVTDGCRGVNVKPGDVDRALDEMRSRGVRLLWSSDLLQEAGKRP